MLTQKIEGDNFKCFSNAVNLNSSKLSSIMKCRVEMGDVAVQIYLVVELAKITRVKKLYFDRRDGVPDFSWRRPNANFEVSQRSVMNSFQRGPLQSETWSMIPDCQLASHSLRSFAALATLRRINYQPVL